MRIGVIGAGYVGLVTAAVFADLGNDVVGYDKDEARIVMLQRSELPFYEPGLEEMVRRNQAEGRLRFTTDVAEMVDFARVIFIAVGTPPDATGDTDLRQVEEAARAIAGHMKDYKVIVNKSTVPVGTGDLVRQIIETHQRKQVPFDVVSNPEFLREGSAIQDMLNPDRIVIGAPSQQVAMTVMELYAPLGRPILVTDIATAEIIKYASNAFLAMKISFINAIADLCEMTGADVEMVARGIGMDHRIGPHFLGAGLGYGGSCFPKDVLALIHTARRYGVDASIFEATDRINRSRVERFVRKMETVLEGLAGKTIGILGLSFKPDTDDLREARSLELIRRLLDADARVQVYDPVAIPRVRPILGETVGYSRNAYEAAQGAHALAIVTEWREFRQIDLERVRTLMR
ncbi:MAG: UDP-glucose/GDP-mannose dehydrogenase family protein, partial [Acidobacteria bacterium]|nr:UDP-glucose/GDP-mannose dehydrogenase family protein [Acidobacteriota bacterium]MDW7984271.1 UDP-glucose/GDP-mannose dehydrogenase family protein [Acidobacteriota bacterium]